MGQKFSDLKGFFSAMDHMECGNVNGDNEENQNFLPLVSDNNQNNDTSAISIDNAGNHNFVSTYGTATSLPSLNSTNSSLQDEENGNVQESQTQAEPQVENNLQCGSNRNLLSVNGASVQVADGQNKKKCNQWVLKLNCTSLKSGRSSSISSSSEKFIGEPHSCVCTGYRRTDDHHLGPGIVNESAPVLQEQQPSASLEPKQSVSYEQSDIAVVPDNPIHPVIDLSKFNPDDYPIEDCDEKARLERAREIAEGVEPPPGFQPGRHIQLLCPQDFNIDSLTALFQTRLSLPASFSSSVPQLEPPATWWPPQGMVHTQVDYIHCLVPDLSEITNCSFYWGKMDRYEAERLLDGHAEGTFLLRDSTQEEFVFSVSFRRYGRPIHARIEQWNHRYSFDSHDPGVVSSSTVCGLIEQYAASSCYMFFEPLLTIPLPRTFPFSLKHLCRVVVTSRCTYDGINLLAIPKSLKSYLKEYHYKQRVRVRRFDSEP